jgi:hypothetical protein
VCAGAKRNSASTAAQAADDEGDDLQNIQRLSTMLNVGRDGLGSDSASG